MRCCAKKENEIPKQKAKWTKKTTNNSSKNSEKYCSLKCQIQQTWNKSIKKASPSIISKTSNTWWKISMTGKLGKIRKKNSRILAKEIRVSRKLQLFTWAHTNNLFPNETTKVLWKTTILTMITVHHLCTQGVSNKWWKLKLPREACRHKYHRLLFLKD